MSEPSLFPCRICGRRPVATMSVINPSPSRSIHCPVHTQNYGWGRTPSAACHNWNANNVIGASTAETVRP